MPTLDGGLQFVDRNGEPRGVKNPDNNNFAPRVGLAYKLTDRLVLRSGFGIFYSPTTGNGPGGSSVGALTFDSTTNVTTHDRCRPYRALRHAFPAHIPTGFDSSLPTIAEPPASLLGQGISAQFRNDRTPYSAQWNFDLQYQVSKDSLLDVAYAGNAGVKLLAEAELDQLPDKDLSLGSALTQKVTNPFFGVIPATTSLGQATTTYGQLLRPYPQFTNVQETWGSLAHSSYNSLQVKFHKRYGNGLQFLVAYTWSKLIDDYSSVASFLGQQNPGYTDNDNRRLDRSLSSLDQAHRLVGNYQYQLPFGKGRRFLNHGVTGAVVGGWDINGITTIQSGLPISITSAINTTNSFGGLQLPDSTGISTRSPGSVGDRINGYFNPAAFSNPPQYTFGNVGAPDCRQSRSPLWHIDTDLTPAETDSNFRRIQTVRGCYTWRVFQRLQPHRLRHGHPSGTVSGVRIQKRDHLVRVPPQDYPGGIEVPVLSDRGSGNPYGYWVARRRQTTVVAVFVMNRPDEERDVAPNWIESRQVVSAERLADVSHSVLEASEISSN